MNIRDTEIVLETLSSRGYDGCGVISLSLETGISQSSLRRFLIANKDFCTPIIGQSKFRINKFGPQRGSVQAMINVIQKRKQQRRNVTLVIWFIFSFYLFLIW